MVSNEYKIHERPTAQRWCKHCSKLMKQSKSGTIDAYPAALAPSVHPWSWVRWSGCSPCSDGGPPASRWSPAPGAQRVWGAPPSDRCPILRSPAPSTSPGPTPARSPSLTLRLPHAKKQKKTIEKKHRVTIMKVFYRVLLHSLIIKLKLVWSADLSNYVDVLHSKAYSGSKQM